MNRQQIMDIRMALEPMFFMQTIHSDRITYACLLDDRLYDVYPDSKCPDCKEGYILYPHDTSTMCFCNECDYIYESEPVYSPMHESFRCELIFDKGECAPDTFERFMEDIEKLYHYYYDEEFSLLLERDMAAEESTLGLID